MEPDHYLEEYWKQFKQLIKKFQTEFKVINNSDIDLQNMVENLNYLKSESRYIEIEMSIEKYVAMIGWVMIKNYHSYNFGLYKTQLKNWKKIPSVIPDNDVRQNSDDKTYFKHLNDPSFELYLNLVSNLVETTDEFNEHYITLFNKLHIPDYDGNDMSCISYNMNLALEFVPLLVQNKKIGSLTTISNSINLVEKIQELYGVTVFPKMDGRKIINLIAKNS
jgi:hypothetical protein